MALIPIHIDTVTGEIVAKPITGDGSVAAAGFLFTQSTNLGTWLINHGVGKTTLICQVYSTTGEFILPDKITIVDPNTITIEFGTPFAGTAHLVFFE